MTAERREIKDERCRVHLAMFEGPLDLLLYLIKRDEIDIYDIPIAHVVEEYISFIEGMEELDLSSAGEYLLMASLLMSIKSRMLLPKPPVDEDEIEDPRQELVDMLLEYKIYKKISEVLGDKREEQEHLFPRGSYPDKRLARDPFDSEHARLDVYSLIRTAWDLLKEEDLIVPGSQSEDVDVSERMEHIMSELATRGRARFIDFFDGPTTPMLFVGTFVGLLELVREKQVRVRQQSAFGNIWIYPNPEGRGG